MGGPIPLDERRLGGAPAPSVWAEIEGLIVPAAADQVSGFGESCNVRDRSRVNLHGKQFRFAFLFFNGAKYAGIVDGILACERTIGRLIDLPILTRHQVPHNKTSASWIRGCAHIGNLPAVWREGWPGILVCVEAEISPCSQAAIGLKGRHIDVYIIWASCVVLDHQRSAGRSISFVEFSVANEGRLAVCRTGPHGQQVESGCTLSNVMHGEVSSIRCPIHQRHHCVTGVPASGFEDHAWLTALDRHDKYAGCL